MNYSIAHEEDAHRGAFYIEQDGERLAEMTYRRAGEGLIVIDHTYVDVSLRRQGIARRLLDAAVQWARESGIGVKATCSYVAAQFAEDASIRDVLA